MVSGAGRGGRRGGAGGAGRGEYHLVQAHLAPRIIVLVVVVLFELVLLVRVALPLHLFRHLVLRGFVFRQLDRYLRDRALGDF